MSRDNTVDCLSIKCVVKRGRVVDWGDLSQASSLRLFFICLLLVQWPERGSGAPWFPLFFEGRGEERGGGNKGERETQDAEDDFESTTTTPTYFKPQLARAEAEAWIKTKHAYIRTCRANDADYGVDGRKCSSGVIMKEPFVPGCVCLRGVWVIQRQLCSNTPIIVLGRERPDKLQDCYTVDFQVQSLLFLGDKELPFSTKAYVAPQTMTVFQEIPQNGDWTPTLDFKDPIVVVINPRGSIYESEETGECFMEKETDPNPEEENKVHVWATALLSTRYRKVDKCRNPLQAGYQSFATHDAFYYHGNFQFAVPVEGCSIPCPVWTDFSNMLEGPEHKYSFDSDKVKLLYSEWLDVFKLSPGEQQAKMNQLASRWGRQNQPASTIIINNNNNNSLLPTSQSSLIDQRSTSMSRDKLAPGNFTRGLGSQSEPRAVRSTTTALSLLPHTTEEETTGGRISRVDVKGVGRVRNKRRVVRCEVIWNGLAECMNSYWDPLDKFEMPDKDIKYCYPSLDTKPRPQLPPYGK